MAHSQSAVNGVGVHLTAHSYEAPHSKRLWGYPYVEYPIANTYEVDPMAYAIVRLEQCVVLELE